MEFTSFTEWCFLGIVSAGVGILYQMKSSMNDLNVKLAVFVERFEHHQEKLEKLEDRFDNLNNCTIKCINHKTKQHNLHEVDI